MARRFINQLGEHETVREVFLVGNKQLRQNRNGNLYLQMQLSDRTGSVNGMMWNANDHIASTFKNGDFIEIQGTSQFYNGAMQIIVNSLETAKEDSVDQEDFIFVSQQDVESFVAEISELLRGMQNPHLRNLAETFLADEAFMKQLSLAPAAVKHHHAYHGGLLEHVANLMKVAHAVAPFYPAVDHDLLLMGAFLHDLGKLEELSYQRDLAYSDEGQLIGHIVIGIGLLDRKIAEAEKLAGETLPAALVTHLKHMIVSHHGKYEFGSPKLPMTCEAVALNLLDDLDAKIHQFQQIVDGDVNEDSNWTVFQPSLGRKLFKGS